MKEVVRLLELKNEYLEKFLTVTNAFAQDLQNGHMEDVTLLKQNRENILDIIDHIEERIGKLSEENGGSLLGPEEVNKSRFKVAEAMIKRDAYVSAILEADTRLFRLIESEKAQIISDLSELRGISTAFAGYYKNI